MLLTNLKPPPPPPPPLIGSPCPRNCRQLSCLRPLFLCSFVCSSVPLLVPLIIRSIVCFFSFVPLFIPLSVPSYVPFVFPSVTPREPPANGPFAGIEQNAERKDSPASCRMQGLRTTGAGSSHTGLISAWKIVSLELVLTTAFCSSAGLSLQTTANAGHTFALCVPPTRQGGRLAGKRNLVTSASRC